jgi:hypothetical protein
MRLPLFVWTGVSAANWLLNNLVSYYKCDVNGTFWDSHWSNTWTINWATYTASWKINGAYSYTTNDWVDVPLNSTTNFTKSMWVKITADVVWHLMSKYDWSSKMDQLYYYSVDKKIYSNIWQVWGNRNTVSTAAISLNTYYHIAVTRDWTTQKIYLNAWTPVTSAATADNFVDTVNFDIWRRNDPVNYLSWVLDEIGYWDTALTADDITTLYNWSSWLSYDSFTS